MADITEVRHWQPRPAPVMTVPVLIAATVTGCTVGIALLVIDAAVPGRLAPLVRVADPAAAVLVGSAPRPMGAWLPVLALSVVMNAVFYGMVASLALVIMTFAGVRTRFSRHHWLMLTAITAALMVARATVFPV